MMVSVFDNDWRNGIHVTGSYWRGCKETCLMCSIMRSEKTLAEGIKVNDGIIIEGGYYDG